ncbi:hypothetical protein AKUH3B101J_08650 [Apilactobacillus kunkeei]|nr:hypothetical protein AKUH3B104J_08650 [Apilactobacillus kunkeei]CAI2611299.1 hypothetical protein AKUH3B101J_08650 [Apilactobacillus kunkeei]
MAEQKDYFTDLLKNIYSNAINDISVAYIAKIEKITPPTATVQPLARINGKKESMVQKVHFIVLPGQSESIDYKTGDEVIVICLDDDNSKHTNGYFPVSSNRKHSVDYSFVIGKIASKDDFKK